MPDAMLRALAFAEYDFLAIDNDLAELRDKLRRAAGRLPAARTAAKRVREVRGALRRVLAELDVDITAAVAGGRRHVA